MSGHLTPAVGSSDHIQGSTNAPVEIVEYGDYECPYCADAHPIVKKIQKTFGSQIKFIFRNFPLSEIHQYATLAATAAEAAGKQGKFWQMHDSIYEHQDELSRDGLFEMAKQIGLNILQFEKDMEDPAIGQKVEDDFESGVRSGVNGTPSFFVNGKKFDGGAEDLFTMLMENAE